MKIVAEIPSSRAAHATAWPWLPALAATTPAARSAGDRLETVLNAPRILNEPVRCKFSAFSTTSRPIRWESMPKPYTGVTRACAPIRSRAARTSASVGVVVVAMWSSFGAGLQSGIGDPEDALKDRIYGAERVELPTLDLVEEPAELRVARDLALQAAACPRRRDREHLGREVPPAALGEPTLGLEPLPVLLDSRPQLLHAVAADRLREDDRRPALVAWPECKRLAHVVHGRRRERVVALVDRDHVRDLHDPRLQRLDRVARAGHEHEHDRVGDRGHADLA